jgi:hypothetical protein
VAVRWFVCAVALATTVAPACRGQIYADNLPAGHPAIRYAAGPLDDPVTRLINQIDSGKITLEFRAGGLGYLPSLLEKLGVPVDSQALVFSKTSFQGTRISPRNPRAIYFDDDVAVGFVPGGEGMELAAFDRRQGVVFYTLDAQKADLPRFTRREVCLKCHQGPSTLGVPGMFIGSVFPNPTGMPSRSGAIVTDHRTSFSDRWGGWYVTASRGEQLDRANSIAPNPADPEALDTAGNQNVASLAGRLNLNGYLAPTSDIVALMTFEHQTQMINFITRLGWEARIAAYEGKTGDAGGERQIESDIESAVTYMLFAGEVPLREPIQGVSSFTRTFPRRGPRDAQGRSLRDFDLQTRLFRYPLSYMIYSAAFDALPDTIRERIYHRLYDVLAGLDQSKKFASLSQPDRRAILEILRDTKPNLPPYWKSP